MRYTYVRQHDTTDCAAAGGQVPAGADKIRDTGPQISPAIWGRPRLMNGT